MGVVKDSFIAQARKREQPLTSVPYAVDSGPRPARIRNVGLLERVRLLVQNNVTYTTAGPTAVDQMNKYCGPIARLTLRVGSLGTIYDLSGYNAALVTAIDRFYRRGVTSLAHSPYVFTTTPALAATVNVFPLSIPLGINLETFDAPVGLVQTAVQGQDVILEIRHTPIAGNTTDDPGVSLYLGNPANLSPANYAASKTDIAYDYYDPIPEEYPNAQPNLSVLHTWTQQEIAVTGNGDFEIPLNPSNLYVRFVITIVSGIAGALNITNDWLTKLKLQFGGSQAPYEIDARTLKQRMADDYGNVAWPGGVYILDLLQDSRTERDAFNAAASTNPRLVLSLAGGTFGSGSKVVIAYEQLVPMNDGRGTYGPQGPR